MIILHQLTKNKRPAISFFFLEYGTIFGCCASISWGSFNGWKADNSEFIFNLINNTKFDIKNNENAIYYASNYSLNFGHFGYDKHANYDLKNLCVHRKGGGGNFHNGKNILS